MSERSQFMVIPKKRVDADAIKVTLCEYLLAINRDFVADSGSPLIPPTAINWLGNGLVSAALTALGDPKPITFYCNLCGRSIFYQDCPTGGWWIHDFEFPNDHDAVCGGYGSDDD